MRHSIKWLNLFHCKHFYWEFPSLEYLIGYKRLTCLLAFQWHFCYVKFSDIPHLKPHIALIIQEFHLLGEHNIWNSPNAQTQEILNFCNQTGHKSYLRTVHLLIHDKTYLCLLIKWFACIQAGLTSNFHNFRKLIKLKINK